MVGANLDDDNGIDSGSAYLFDTTTGNQIATLVAEDGAAGDGFSFRAVALSGTTAIVGACCDDDNGGTSGSAYLFDTTTGQQIHKLLPDDGAAGDQFGDSVAISGTTAIVGAWFDDDIGENSGLGLPFDATTGLQIVSPCPMTVPVGPFGVYVAIDGKTAIVGALGDDYSGSAYLFDTTTGQQIHKLLPDAALREINSAIPSRSAGPLSSSGAPNDDDNGEDSGSAYLFDTTTGNQLAKLLADDGEAGDVFGPTGVAMSETTAVVGLRRDDDNGEDSALGLPV